jgi:hypothetical protein
MNTDATSSTAENSDSSYPPPSGDHFMLYSGVLENLLKKGFNTQPLEMAAITSK